MVVKHIPNIYLTYTLLVTLGIKVYVEVHDRYMIGTCQRIIYLRRISYLQRPWRRLGYMMGRFGQIHAKRHVNGSSQYITCKLQCAAYRTAVPVLTNNGRDGYLITKCTFMSTPWGCSDVVFESFRYLQ